MKQNNLLDEKQSLPIEIIFDQFSAENGEKLLHPFFGRIKAIDFKNTLVFQPQEIDHFLDYFQFKKSFFLTGTDAHNKTIINQLVRELQDTAMKKNLVTMCKDDRIFICFSTPNSRGNIMKKQRKHCLYCGGETIKKNEDSVRRDFCPACNSYFYENPLPVVSAILESSRRILLVKRGRAAL